MLKRTCLGCKALERSANGGYFCELGYSIDVVYRSSILIASVKPLEYCEKPTTTKKLFDIKIDRMRKANDI